MAVVDDLKRMNSAEDFFHYLGVAYDAAVLNRARLHNLRRMGESLVQVHEDGPKHRFG